MNELLFASHALLVTFFTFGSLRFGKEALIAFAALQALAANFFVLKQTVLFGWNVTCSDVFAVGSLLTLNLLQEHFGKEAARKAVWICFFSMIFFAVMSQIHLFYNPSPEDQFQSAYTLILSPAPRLLCASLISFLVVQTFDVLLFGLIKRKMPSSGWSLRSLISVFVSQGLDTVLFSLLGLWGLVSHLGSIMAASFAVKICTILTMQGCAAFSKRTPNEI